MLRNRRVFYGWMPALLLLFSLNACMTVSYVGDRFQPTEQVDVYYSAKDVKHDYKVIGHLSELVRGFNGEERAKMEIIKKGKEVGADAVVILGFEHAGTDDTKTYQKAEAIRYLD